MKSKGVRSSNELQLLDLKTRYQEGIPSNGSQPMLELLFWYPAMRPSLRNSLDDWAPVNEI